MKSNTKQNLNKLLANGKDNALDEFLAILEFPDEKFDQIWSRLKGKLTALFDSQKFQTDTLQALQMLPVENIDAEKQEAEQLLKELNEDDSVSKNKKEMITMIVEKTIIAIINLVKVPRERIKVKIQRINENAVLPKYVHDTDAGADLCSVEEITLKPYETKIIPTGLKMEIPAGYECQVRPRSGLSLKSPLRIANCVGTIDSDYRGEIGVVMHNTSGVSYTIKQGDKIAQMLIAPTPMMVFEEVTELSNTDRGEGGFGSTDAN